MATVTVEQQHSLDGDIAALRSGAGPWARLSVADRIEVLEAIKDAVADVAEAWVTAATRAKQIPVGSPLAGEEWLSGPYALVSTCNFLIETLSELDGRAFLDDLPTRTLPNGQLAVEVLPSSTWDRLLLSGVRAEVWMQDGVTGENLAQHTASAYDVAPQDRHERVALVLGAGNIAAITPLDTLHKLFSEHQVVLLKMNPVNDYLTPFLTKALAPLIARDALRIVKGDGATGAHLTEHTDIDEIHITGSGETHDLIVWGAGAEGVENRRAGTPRITKRITSELGAVCPTIVVPGDWTDADIRFQAENIATQKMHNSGFNCIACQVLVVSEDWKQADRLIAEVEHVIAEMPARGLYYPGAAERMDDFADEAGDTTKIARAGGGSCLISDHVPALGHTEVFAPALSVVRLPGSGAAFLRNAIDFANTELHGTLGANIVIDPSAQKRIDQAAFDELLIDLRYGAIAVNGWTGANFLLTKATWGAFPGHTLDDVQSGIGIVHNTYLFDRPERTVLTAPFRPFPRTLRHGGFTLLPRPPWFITNARAAKLGELLTKFQHRPSWAKLPAIFANALRG